MESTYNANYLNYRNQSNGRDEAIYDYDEKIRYSYGDLERRSNSLGNYLRNKLKIKRGDRVGFCCRNRIELFDAYYATAKIGAILVTYNPRMPGEGLLGLVKNEEPKILFYEYEFRQGIDFLKERATSIETYVNLSKNVKTTDMSYETILAQADEKVIISDNKFEDIHFILHTGGTTRDSPGNYRKRKGYDWYLCGDYVTYDNEEPKI